MVASTLIFDQAEEGMPSNSRFVGCHRNRGHTVVLAYLSNSQNQGYAVVLAYSRVVDE